jgi:hypothetical protein
MEKIKNDKNLIIIGITGFAKTGKDTFAKIAKNLLINKYGYDCHIFSFAEDLKKISNKIVKPNFGINCITATKKEKDSIRPILVGIGEGFRNIDEFFWVKTVIRKINKIKINKKTFVLIPDVRFENEAKWIKSNKNSVIISINRKGIKPPNRQEIKNIPVIKNKYADLKIKWENIGSENILTNTNLNSKVFKVLEKKCVK